MSSFLEIIQKKVIYRRTVRWLGRVSLPGFKKVPIGQIIKYFAYTLQNNDISMRASAMAFNFFMALFPAAIFFFTMIAFIPVDNLANDIMKQLGMLLPQSAFKAIEKTLNDILRHQRGGLLSLGFFSALIFSSNTLYNMFKAFNLYDSTIEKRSDFKRRILSLILTIFISLALIISVTLLTVGQYALNWMDQKNFLSSKFVFYTLVVIKWIFSIYLFQMVIASLYYFGSSVKRKFVIFNPGIILATFATITTTAVFAYYVNQFNSYNKVYGSIGTLLVILFLIYLNSLIILYGYELNAGIEKLEAKKVNPELITAEKLTEETKLENTPIKN